MSFARLSLVVALAASLPSVLSVAQQAPPSADTFVSSATPNANYGSDILVAVGPGTTGYMKFDLSAVPSGAVVSKATLRLYVDAVHNRGPDSRLF